MKTTSNAKLKGNKKEEKTNSSFYDLKINTLDGSALDFSSLEGKYVLFVNVASKCGFTNQYEELQKLSDTYPNNLVVIGSPCNQFRAQEPGDASEIQSFCQLNFGVTFLLTEKLDVKGTHQHPLYRWLTKKELNAQKSSSVKWNFQKYLVNPKGNLVDYYFSITKPMSTKITKHLK